MRIIHFLFLLILSLFSIKSLSQQTQKNYAFADSIKSVAIIELFSSEDCSSCPEADAMVNKIALDAANARQPVFVLEEHVDYLNHFGWKDTFANKQFEDRQLAYQHFFKKNASYTPQILVNGTREVYAANLSMADLVIEEALKIPSQVNITFSINNYADSTAEADYHLSSINKNWIINFAVVQKIGISHVTAGENSGRTLTHLNIVEQLQSDNITIPDGIMPLMHLPLYKPNTYSIIVFVQDKQTMKIVGATQMDI